MMSGKHKKQGYLGGLFARADEYRDAKKYPDDGVWPAEAVAKLEQETRERLKEQKDLDSDSDNE